jgi:hypothetical protein
MKEVPHHCLQQAVIDLSPVWVDAEFVCHALLRVLDHTWSLREFQS